MTKESVAMSSLQLGSETPIVIARAHAQVLYAGVFGSLDSERMLSFSERLTKACEETRGKLVIVDLNNVGAIDSAVSENLLRVATAVRLMGVQTIFCGIDSRLANIMVTSGVNLGGFEAFLDLESALQRCYAVLGLKLVSA